MALGSEAKGGIQWCPNSPNLAPLDSCIWGVMKSFIFAHLMPTNSEELVNKIKQVWKQSITEYCFKQVTVGFLNRARKVVGAGGQHQVNE